MANNVGTETVTLVAQKAINIYKAEFYKKCHVQSTLSFSFIYTKKTSIIASVDLLKDIIQRNLLRYRECQMAEKNIKTRILYLLLFLSVVCILMPEKHTKKANFAISSLINFFTSKPYSLAAETSNKVEEIIQQDDKYDKLLKKYDNLLLELNNTRSEIEYQRRHIEELANIRSEFSFGRATLVRAHISAEDTSISRKNKIVNRGSRDGVRPGLIALASCETYDTELPQTPNTAVWKSAVAGKIVSVGISSSIIQMLNDPAFSETVIIKSAYGREENFESEGIIYFDGKGNVKVKHVETSCPVMAGDPIFLKASEKTMPVDVIIGYVSICSYNPDNAVLWNITVKPAVNLSDIKDVIIVFHGTEE